MLYLKYFHAAATIALVIAAAIILFAYRASHQAQLQLTSQLKSAQQSITEAATREKSRDAILSKSLTTLAKQKSTIRQPIQIIKSLPDVLPLPTAISLAPESSMPSKDSTASNRPASPSPNLTLPAQDLKPLYDFAIDCK